MKCPICGGAELVTDTRDLPYTYKNELTVIQAVHGEFCPACGESILAGTEATRVASAMLAFNTKVDAAVVDPLFIISVRKK
ncbi:type II toxin-antitoxin system MqsA family antitoxin [Pseudomonas atacamensis]|uniref:type II toxin-antitoxin system MqsA family antitoxin n=1 Tax=Pseudomonas atacamensis TaxID=2565368 RepID=UPI00298F213F|nr:type II toxin-antitoxin system MqsA family antitoxin [Pseudomonas atacamensis]